MMIKQNDETRMILQDDLFAASEKQGNIGDHIYMIQHRALRDGVRGA